MSLYDSDGKTNGKGIPSEFGPLLYTFLRGVEASRNAGHEYEEVQREGIFNPNEEMTTQFVKSLLTEIISKYDLNEQTLLNLVPPRYREMAKLLYSMKWGNVIEIISNVAKEYGKDRETGEYRNTQEVVGEALKQFVGHRVLERILK